ncbi:MAG: hypothetical protein KDD11_00915 [Acidobacteria bacterium]|nr:hypothetical protein [Acidobacteriota bacterium]
MGPSVSNPVEVYLESLPARKERTAREVLETLAARIEWPPGPRGGKREYDILSAPWWALTVDDVNHVREQLVNGEWVSESSGEPYTPPAVNRFLNSLRGVLRQCWKDGRMPVASYLEAAAALKTVSASSDR